jgi:tRNA dimethylallyltransferase
LLLPPGKKIRVPVIVGPTAAGKTAISIALARKNGWEILSCDSRQIYRHMNIGTAKPSADERALVPHWLIDIIDPPESYSAFRFSSDSLAIIRAAAARGVTTLICGGTGLYLKRLGEGIGPQVAARPEFVEACKKKVGTEGPQIIFKELQRVDPQSAARVHPNNTARIIRALQVYHDTGVPFSQQALMARGPEDVEFFPVILSLSRDILYRRIDERVDAMATAGLWDEFRGLRRRGYGPDHPGMRCVGYQELFGVEQGTVSLGDAIDTIKMHSRRYAKRQVTWFTHQTEGFTVDAADADAIGKINDYFSQSLPE